MPVPMSAMLPPPVAPRLASRQRARLAGVVLGALVLHGVVLAFAQRELRWDLPPAVQVTPVQLFALPAPLAVSAAASAPVTRTRAIRTPPAAAPSTGETVSAPGTDTGATAGAAVAATPPDAVEEEPPPQSLRTEAAAGPPPPRPAAAAEAAATQASAMNAVMVTLPAHGRLVADATASRGVLSMRGTSVTDWKLADGQYLTTNEVRDEFDVQWLRLTSSGTVRPDVGIAPVRYTERTARRAEVATNFQWDTRKVTFSSTAAEFPLEPGVQDRLSIAAHLALLAAAFPERFTPGATIALPVAGPRDVRVYQMRVVGWETTRSPLGPLETLKLDRALEPEQKDARLELWLAPVLRWLPARARTTLPNGDTIETLVREASFDAPR